MATDPAVEAAKRTFAEMPGLAEPMEQPVFKALLTDIAESSAREALDPLKKSMLNALSIASHSAAITQDFYDLVDELKPLIFSTDELDALDNA